MARLEQAMASGSSDQATLDDYATAQARLEHAGGYDWRRRAMTVVRGLGFAEDDLDRSLQTFSGGELTRGSLARTLAGDPDLLLLDEPTNHLDVASLEWLEEQLTSTDAAIVLVAHDRWFLEAVGTAVLELEGGRSRFFAGPWHAWRKERAARELALGRAIERQQAEIERMERFVTRFRAGTRSRQAQARVKKLAKMQRLEQDPRAGRALGFKFEPGTRSGRVALELEGATIAAGERKLLEDAELWLERGEHVTLVGPNGAGKTTLIETLAGRRALTDGKLRRGHNAELGFLSQHAEEIGGEGTALEAVQRATGLTPNKARALLGRFLFSGADAEKEVAVLSGGELRRLSLAVLVASGANVLILDEPTNHLDLESREALEDALRAHDGALLLVSHDRALLDAVGTRTIALEDGRLRSYEGGWADYMRVREERRDAAESAKRAAPGRGDGRRPSRPARGPVGTAGRLQELEAAHRRPRAGCRRGGICPGGSRGRARGSRVLVLARALGRVDRAPCGRQAGGRAALRGAFEPRRLTELARQIALRWCIGLPSGWGFVPPSPSLSSFVPSSATVTHRGGEEGTFRVPGPAGPHGSVAAAISNAAVKLLSEYTGRGPTKARTTISRDLVVILLAETMTKAEKTLATNGEAKFVLDMRHRFQLAMRDDLVNAVELATERKVIAFMSDNHIDPDMAAEVFVLEPQAEPVEEEDEEPRRRLDGGVRRRDRSRGVHHRQHAVESALPEHAPHLPVAAEHREVELRRFSPRRRAGRAPADRSSR